MMLTLIGESYLAMIVGPELHCIYSTGDMINIMYSLEFYNSAGWL